MQFELQFDELMSDIRENGSSTEQMALDLFKDLPKGVVYGITLLVIGKLSTTESLRSKEVPYIMVNELIDAMDES